MYYVIVFIDLFRVVREMPESDKSDDLFD